MTSMNPFLFSGDSLKTLFRPSSEPAGDSANAAPAPRILVVDDEALIADTICQILNRNGFIAEAAYSGSEAIETAKRICPDTRIVLFSGQAATVEILERAKKRGHTFELLPKPIHPTQLIKHLRE